MYTFRFQVDEKDHFESILCHAYTVPKYRKRLMMERFLYPVLFMGIAFLFGLLSEYRFILYIDFGILSVAWIFLFRKLVQYKIRKNMKVMAQTGKMPYGEEITRTFDEEKMSSMTADTESSRGYSSIEKIVLGENAMYLYIYAASAVILPYRAFAGNEEKEAFLRFIQEKTHAPLVKGVTR